MTLKELAADLKKKGYKTYLNRNPKGFASQYGSITLTVPSESMDDAVKDVSEVAGADFQVEKATDSETISIKPKTQS